MYSTSSLWKGCKKFCAPIKKNEKKNYCIVNKHRLPAESTGIKKSSSGDPEGTAGDEGRMGWLFHSDATC
jgi:hypothetical protein